MMRRVLGEAWALAMLFSALSMIQTVRVPSAVWGALLMVFELTLDLDPLPNFGFSPLNTGTVPPHSLRISTDVLTGPLLDPSLEDPLAACLLRASSSSRRACDSAIICCALALPRLGPR